MTDTNCKFRGVLSSKIPIVWPTVKKLLQPSLQYSDRKFTIDDVYNAIRNCDMQLWIVQDQYEEIIAAIVTQIISFPRKKVLFLLFIAGVRYDEWTFVLSDLIEFAKANQCQSIEGYGRPGWERKAKPLGFKKVHTVYSLNLWGQEHEKNMDENCISAQ